MTDQQGLWPVPVRAVGEVEQALMADLQLLVVHGILRLLGHDHAEVDDETTMWKAQKEILGRLGLDGMKIPGSE